MCVILSVRFIDSMDFQHTACQIAQNHMHAHSPICDKRVAHARAASGFRVFDLVKRMFVSVKELTG